MVSLLRDDIYLRAKTNADFHHKFSHLSKCLNSEWEVGDDLWRLTSETRFPVHDNEINDQDIRSTFEEYLRKDDSQFKNATEMCRENTCQRDFEAERAQRVPELFIKFTPSAMERVIYLSMERLIDGVKDEVVMGEWMIHQ
jgi:hypothetical protein